MAARAEGGGTQLPTIGAGRFSEVWAAEPRPRPRRVRRPDACRILAVLRGQTIIAALRARECPQRAGAERAPEISRPRRHPGRGARRLQRLQSPSAAGRRAARGRRLQLPRPPDPLGPLLQVPRARRPRAQGRPAPRHRGRALRGSSRAGAPSCRGSTRRSELVHRILSTDPAVMMPTPESHLTLNDYERACSCAGSSRAPTWKPHWAFIPPVKAGPAGDRRHAHRRLGDRRLRRRPPAAGRPRAGSRGEPRDAAAPRHLRPHGPAAHGRGGRRLPRDDEAPGLRARGGSPARLAPRTASAWPPSGSTSPATPTRTATRTTGCATCRRGATG
jgi:hypothetical protein